MAESTTVDAGPQAMATNAKASKPAHNSTSRLPRPAPSRELDSAKALPKNNTEPAKNRSSKGTTAAATHQHISGSRSTKSKTALPRMQAPADTKSSIPSPAAQNGKKRKKPDARTANDSILPDLGPISDDPNEPLAKRHQGSDQAYVVRGHIGKATPAGRYHSIQSYYTIYGIEKEKRVLQDVYKDVSKQSSFKNSNYISHLDAEYQEKNAILEILKLRFTRLQNEGNIDPDTVAHRKPLKHFRATSKELQKLKSTAEYKIVQTEMCKLFDSYKSKVEELKEEMEQATDDSKLEELTANIAAFNFLKTFAQAGTSAAHEGAKNNYDLGAILI